MKNYLLLLFCSVFIFNSCNNQEESNENKIPITVLQIGKGDLVGNNIPQQNTIITTSAEWNALLTNLDSSNNISGGFTETNIDFNQFMIIATFDQIFPNGGHSIDVITVDENPLNIVVDIEKLLTGNVTTVVTQPYHIVKIPKSTKPIIFQ